MTHGFSRLMKKTMARTEWKRIIRREYLFKNFNADEFRGSVGILRLLEVREPLSVKHGAADVKVADTNYEWLQFAYEGKNHWLTVMFDDSGEIVQYYFDITDGNFIEPDGGSWFYDLYLDVVVLPDGQTSLLDENELYDALQDGIINQAQYDLAYASSRELINGLKGRINELAMFCIKYRNILKESIS